MHSGRVLCLCVSDVTLLSCILTLFVYILHNRFEDNGTATVPFVVTNVPLQSLELPKAQPYMTVGKYHNAEPWFLLRATMTVNTGANPFHLRPFCN